MGADYQDNVPRGSTWGGIPLYNGAGAFNAVPRSFNQGAAWSRWEQYTRTGFATLEHSLDSGWVAKAQFNHQINGYDANLGAGASGFPDPADGSGVSMWAGQYIGRTTSDAADVYASGPVRLGGREHELVLGGSATNRRWKNRGWWDTQSVGYDTTVADFYRWNGSVPAPAWGAAPDYTNDEATRERGLYATARWNLRDDLQLITGGRVLSYRTAGIRESGSFVPYIGAVYDIDGTWSAYASYTTIFKPQSAQDASGRTLDPLEGENREIGVKAAFFGGRLHASAAYFDLLQDNYAEATGGLTPTGGTAYRAIQGVRTKGFEVEASGRIGTAWQVQAGFSHSIARQQGERVSTLTPASQFSLYASYKPAAVPGLTLGGGARWQDKTWGDVSHPAGTVRHTVPGYWIADASARYAFTPRLTGALALTNLFDRKYYTIFSSYSTYTWGEPRSVNASLTYRF
ncbi:TonB-dependent siderophore receptor [Xylophilus sp.]|uniref:TonB-dependent siderophore receptor n=1 Tax=Xylophilus sp. TaxID=2653893 RepID=UPI0013B820AA|nr:MAG: Ferripyoverdine receptor [Xylophilus sp.]